MNHQKTKGKHERLADRLATILQKLNNGETLMIDDLANEFLVDKRTIYRDLNVRLGFLGLQKVGLGTYRLDAEFFHPTNIENVRRFAKLASISDLFGKIDQDFFEKHIKETIKVTGFDYEKVQHKQSYFELLTRAIDNKNCISFEYSRTKHNDNKMKSYQVEPYRLINRKGVWYLLAVHDTVIKTFSFARIFNLIIESKEFQPDLNIIKKINGSESIYFLNTIDEVIIKVQPVIALYFCRRKIFTNQEIIRELTDGTLYISCKNVHEKEILPQVQYWLPHIEIESPSFLQTKLLDNLRQYLGRFRS